MATYSTFLRISWNSRRYNVPTENYFTVCNYGHSYFSNSFKGCAQCISYLRLQPYLSTALSLATDSCGSRSQLAKCMATCKFQGAGNVGADRFVHSCDDSVGSFQGHVCCNFGIGSWRKKVGAGCESVIVFC